MPLLNKTKVEIKEDAVGVTTYSLLPACTSIPDFGVDPEKVDTTTLDDNIKTNEFGVGDAGDVKFSFRYRKGATEAYAICKALEDAGKKVLLKITYADGMTIEFSGTGVSTKILGGEVNTAKNFELNIALSSSFDITPGV